MVGCIYKPPHLSITKFNDKLNDLLNLITRENKDIYLLGDFNINIGDTCSNNLHVQEFRNILASHFFAPLIHKPSRIHEKSATIIDQIYTNVGSTQSLCAGLFATKAFSDHFAL